MRILVMLLLLSNVLLSKAQIYTPIDSESKISFKIKNFGLTVEGNLTGLKGTVVFNPNELAQSKFNVSVETSSINTSINARDKHLKKEEYFDVVSSPLIRFVSGSIKLVKPNSYIVSGKLTIKKTTKEISFPFTAEQKPNGYLLRGEFKIDRTEYDIGGNSMTMADDLIIILSVLAQDKN